MSEPNTPSAAGHGNEQSADQLRAHTFDGIQEFDNKLPNWWLWILYGSIIFSFAYWIVFHTLAARDLPYAAFEKEMIAAAEAQVARAAAEGLSDESLQLMATIPARTDEGRALFAQYCVVCHLDQGQGLVGPNLTDAYWLHGGRPLDIHKVITEGVPAKGMAAWGNQLGPRRVESVTAFVLTLLDTNVPGKAPEGELYEATE
jgi:cytochrome c oxidase cbb3-type subunit 3